MKKIFTSLGLVLILFIMIGCSNSSILLSFETNTNQNIEDVKITKNTVLPIPEKEGYVFLGWYIDQEFNNEFILHDYTNLKESNIVIKLYAKWDVREFEINYILDGGINASSNPNHYNIYDQINLFNPTKLGQFFLGWYDNEDFNGEPVKSITIGTTGDQTLYARWMSPLTVTFDSNGGTPVASKNQSTLNGVISQPPNPSRAGYVFSGWYLSETNNNGSGTQVTWPYVPTEDVTLYAKWTALLTVTFDSNGGTTISNRSQATIGGSILKPTDPIKSGYVFEGWYLSETDNNGSGTQVTWPYVPTINVTLYAKWAELYAVTFDSNGGTIIDSISQTTLQGEIIQPNNPIKEGYLFEGWYFNESDDNGGGEQVIFPYVPTSHITIYAKWVVPFTIHFDSNGGTNIESISQMIVDGEITKPANPSKSGYAFEGWYLSEIDDNGSGEVVVWPFIPTENIIIYARWEISFTIHFDSNGGTTVESRSQTTFEGAITKPIDPTRSGYLFDGWYFSETSDNGSGEQVTWPYIPTDDITLYAKWDIIYTINFDSNGGTTIESRSQTAIGGSITKPTDPTRSGYVFDGWYLSETNNNGSGTIVTWPYIPNNSITVYARWSAIQLGTSFSNAYSMSLNTGYTANINQAGKIVYFKFTPTISGNYTFYSTGSLDTYASLYNPSLSVLASNDDSGTNYNFSITYSLTSGQTYYLAVRLYSGSSTGSFLVYVTR